MANPASLKRRMKAETVAAMAMRPKSSGVNIRANAIVPPACAASLPACPAKRMIMALRADCRSGAETVSGASQTSCMDSEILIPTLPTGRPRKQSRKTIFDVNGGEEYKRKQKR